MANKARASHILVKTEEQAKEILAKIKNGESFSTHENTKKALLFGVPKNTPILEHGQFSAHQKSNKLFSEMAEQFSLCPSKKRGGSLDEFGRGQMVKEFEKAVFDNKKGDIVLCKTQFGWHIIRIEDLRG